MELNQRLAIATVAVLVASLGSAATAQEMELKNDGFAAGQQAGFQAGFITGEHGASTFDPGAGPVTVTKVQLLFGGATTTESVTLRVYDDTAGNAVPGAELYNGDYDLIGANNALSEIDLTAASVVVPGRFRVSIEFQHDGVPSIARDNDGSIMAGRNWINGSGGIGWVDSQVLGLSGDWVIRAFIVGGGVLTDAGPGTDGGGTGGACALNSDCPNGQYCAADDTCSLDCRANIDCMDNQICNSIGQCEDGTENVGCGCQSGGDNKVPLGAILLIGLCAIGLRRRR